MANEASTRAHSSSSRRDSWTKPNDSTGKAARHAIRLRSLGYREFLAYLHGEQSLEHGTARMKQLTRNFAKRQLTWFRADKRVRWLHVEVGRSPVVHVDEICGWINQYRSA